VSEKGENGGDEGIDEWVKKL